MVLNLIKVYGFLVSLCVITEQSHDILYLATDIVASTKGSQVEGTRNSIRRHMIQSSYRSCIKHLFHVSTTIHTVVERNFRFVSHNCDLVRICTSGELCAEMDQDVLLTGA